VRIKFGTVELTEGPEKTAPVFWDSEKVLNSHFTLIGPSGSGKTTRLRRLMAGMNLINPKVRFIVLDPHGDMGVKGESSFRFSETAEVGLNPLRVREDLDYGGVRKAIRTFISTINRTSRMLGSKQEYVVSNLLLDLYEKAGFIADDPRTWSLLFDPRQGEHRKRHPTVSDLRRFAEYKLTQVFLGTSGAAVAALDELSRKMRSLDRAVDKEARGLDGPDVEALKTKARDLFQQFLDTMETGREVDDLIKYKNREVLQSCFERISNLEATGIFKPHPPTFDPAAPIWRYDLSALSSDEQRMVVDFVLEDLFADARGEGQKDSTELFVVLDEAHKFVSDENDHCISVWAREARKFGLGLILSSQNLKDFPDEVLAQMGTTFVLGVASNFLDVTARKLKVEPKRLAGIQVHRTSLISIHNKGDSGKRWHDMHLV